MERSFLLDDWRRRESDLLFEIPLVDDPGAPPALVCLLVEHQSGEDAWMPLRLLVYAALYWERKWKEWEALPRPKSAPSLPPVVPIVFHTGNRPWKTARQIVDLLQGPEALRAYAPEWRTLFWDLAERTPEDLLAATGAWMRALAVIAAEREGSEPFRSTYARVLQQLDQLAEKDQVRRDDLLWFLLSWVLLRRPRVEGAALLELALEAQTTEAQRKELERMSQTIERTWAEEWFAEGEAKGKVEGKAEGKAEAILRTLRVRLGTVPADVAARVSRIESEEQLNALQDTAAVCVDLAVFRSQLEG